MGLRFAVRPTEARSVDAALLGQLSGEMRCSLNPSRRALPGRAEIGRRAVANRTEREPVVTIVVVPRELVEFHCMLVRSEVFGSGPRNWLRH